MSDKQELNTVFRGINLSCMPSTPNFPASLMDTICSVAGIKTENASLEISEFNIRCKAGELVQATLVVFIDKLDLQNMTGSIEGCVDGKRYKLIPLNDDQESSEARKEPVRPRIEPPPPSGKHINISGGGWFFGLGRKRRGVDQK